MTEEEYVERLNIHSIAAVHYIMSGDDFYKRLHNLFPLGLEYITIWVNTSNRILEDHQPE